MWAVPPGEPLWRNPTIGIAACCAYAASGDAAAPPSSVMKSRRFTAQYPPCFRTIGIAHGGLLRCGISIFRLSASGHSRQIGTLPTLAECPLRLESGQIADSFGMSTCRPDQG